MTIYGVAIVTTPIALLVAVAVTVIARTRAHPRPQAVALGASGAGVTMAAVVFLAPLGTISTTTCSLALHDLTAGYYGSHRAGTIAIYTVIAGLLTTTAGHRTAPKVVALLTGTAVLVEAAHVVPLLGRTCDVIDIIDAALGAAVGAVIVASVAHLTLSHIDRMEPTEEPEPAPGEHSPVT